MKIAIIGSRGIPARYGGFEVFAEKLSQELSSLGFEIYVYSKKELKKEKFNMKRVHRVFVPTPKISVLEKLWMSNYAILHASLIKKMDIILLLGVSGAFFLVIPKLLSIKTVLNTDGLEWKRAKWNWLGRTLLKLLEIIGVKLSDYVVADSEAIGKYIESEYKRNCIFIPYGTDKCHFEEKDWTEIKEKFGLEKKNYYIVVGRHVPENNFDTIIKGFLKSKSKKKLVIVSNLTKGVQFNQAEPFKIILTGPIYDRSKLFALRANAFAYIHGHSVGGTNPSLLEAIASKNLILAYDVPFNREVLKKYGFYFSNENDLSKLINYVETNKIDFNGIYSYYKQILKKKYNWEIVAKQYLKIFQNLLQGGEDESLNS